MNRFLLILTACSLLVCLFVKGMRPKTLKSILVQAGVAIHKVAKTATEIDRKVFHLAGLLVPLTYQINLQLGWTQRECAALCWGITIVGVTGDFLRIHSPFVQRNWPMKSILRDKEVHQLCGGSYFSLGCTLAIHF